MAEKNTDRITVKWQGTAGIEQAHALSDELLQAFKDSSDVRLDISEVEDIDITGIQVIIAARKEAEKQQKNFYITGKIPPAIQDFTAASSISLKDYVADYGNEGDKDA
ncbi:STAS domain-containing protein [Treponema zioleckii]|uniref:STAS domain-containing protein n=1 Tax=Treponema zioleckii TaxID=331680 RepID=UPI00168B0FD9|nr:STAS domain-containing protein [Treponema zioleckii]